MIRSLLLFALVAVTLPLAGCATSADASSADSSAQSSPATDIVGLWSYTADSPNQDTGTFSFTGSPGAYEGQILAQGQPLVLSDISLNGSDLSFSFQMPNGPRVRIVGVVTGGTFDGTADAGNYGQFRMTATR